MKNEFDLKIDIENVADAILLGVGFYFIGRSILTVKPPPEAAPVWRNGWPKIETTAAMRLRDELPKPPTAADLIAGREVEHQGQAPVLFKANTRGSMSLARATLLEKAPARFMWGTLVTIAIFAHDHWWPILIGSVLSTICAIAAMIYADRAHREADIQYENIIREVNGVPPDVRVPVNRLRA